MANPRHKLAAAPARPPMKNWVEKQGGCNSLRLNRLDAIAYSAEHREKDLIKMLVRARANLIVSVHEDTDFGKLCSLGKLDLRLEQG